jgi:hypothetical protein
MKIKEISLLIMILIVVMMTVGIVAITDSVTAAGAPAKLSQPNLGANSYVVDRTGGNTGI